MSAITATRDATVIKHRKYMISVELVSPAVAAEWLEINVENRKLIRAHVDGLVRNMLSDDYPFNGQPVLFGHIEVEGELCEVLFDGQHRLTAIVESGCAQYMLVVRNLDAKAHRTIDINRVRTMAHHLQFDKYKNSSQLGATLSVIWAYDHNTLRIRAGGSITKAELYGLLEREPEIAESVNHVAARRSPIYNTADTSAIHRLIWRQGGRELADAFVESLRTDVGLLEGDAILAFQRWTRNAATSQKGGVPRADRMAILIKCFNAWVERASVRQLRWRHGYEEYPLVVVPASMQVVE